MSKEKGKYDEFKVTSGDVITTESWNNIFDILSDHATKIDPMDGTLTISQETVSKDHIKKKLVIANHTIKGDEGEGEIKVESSLEFSTDLRQMIHLWREEYGIGIQEGTTYFRSGSSFAWFLGGKHDDLSRQPGAGGKVLMILNGAGDLCLPARTNPTSDPQKSPCRALVDAGNLLILNYVNDYASGTVTHGRLGIERNAGALDLVGHDHVYIQFYPHGLGAGRKAWLGYGGAGTHTLSIVNDTGDLNLHVPAGRRVLVRGTPPIVFKEYTFSGNPLFGIKTEYSSDEYDAAIVGFSTGIADIDEGGNKTTLMAVYMQPFWQVLFKPRVKTWTIIARLKHHPNDPPDWTVYVMFVRREISSRNY